MNGIQAEEFFIDWPIANVVRTIFAKRWQVSEDLLTSDLPLVLLHDSLGCVGMWRDFPEQLARTLRRPIIAYDRLGFGQSQQMQEPMPLTFIEDEMHMAFAAVKEFFKLNQFALLGHSVGGGMSVCIAARDPNCSHLISIAAQAFVEPLTRAGIRAAQKVFEDPEQFARLTKWHGPRAQWVLGAWITPWLSSGFDDWTIEPFSSKVKCPTLVIHGVDDEFGSVAFPRAIYDSVGGEKQLVLIKDCAHMPHRERTETVIEKTKEFLLF